LLLRQSTHSLQGIVEVHEDANVLPREMVKFIAGYALYRHPSGLTDSYQCSS
jgi:hypothetical protein